MTYKVANPIYDSVFKYLMEDERIAKTILSALLKKEVVSVEMRRHEHTNTTRNEISMFRIDFAARVKEENGDIHLVLIELQKTWLETETLRFRQYLAAQYNAKENIQKEGESKGFAVPMIAVYLLGHRIKGIEQPVVYASHGTCNYDGEEIEDGMKNPFINSLIHDSIIVQLPLLRGKINNHLEKVLSVFDQKRRDKKNRQMVIIEESKFEDDKDMLYILHRLCLATADADLRQDMNVEDEYYTAIEDRDTTIMRLDKTIAEQDGKIAEQNGKIAEQNGKIAEQNGKIAEQNGKIAEQASLLRSMAQTLLSNGMTIDNIANALNISIENVKNILEQ